MIELLVPLLVPSLTILVAFIAMRRTSRGVSAETSAALDALVPTDEQLQREREAYRLLRREMKPAPGSPLDWSLGLLQDECQKKIESRKRPPAPTGTSATSRGREPTPPPPRGGSGQATASTAREHLAHIEHLFYRAGAISAWQMLREVGKVQIGDQEAIRQLRADTQYLRALRAGTNHLPPPPTTGQWEPPDWIQTENVI